MDALRRERFEKVAAMRVDKILHYLTLLGNCSNRNNYEYTEEDVNHMFREISKSIRDTRARFDNEISKKKDTKFKFQ